MRVLISLTAPLRWIGVEKIRDVAAPNLIGPRDCELPQQVWINKVLWVLLAGVRPLVDGLQPHDVQQPDDTTAQLLCSLAERPSHCRT